MNVAWQLHVTERASAEINQGFDDPAIFAHCRRQQLGKAVRRLVRAWEHSRSRKFRRFVEARRIVTLSLSKAVRRWAAHEKRRLRARGVAVAVAEFRVWLSGCRRSDALHIWKGRAALLKRLRRLHARYATRLLRGLEGTRLQRVRRGFESLSCWSLATDARRVSARDAAEGIRKWKLRISFTCWQHWSLAADAGQAVALRAADGMCRCQLRISLACWGRWLITVDTRWAVARRAAHKVRRWQLKTWLNHWGRRSLAVKPILTAARRASEKRRGLQLRRSLMRWKVQAVWKEAGEVWMRRQLPLKRDTGSGGERAVRGDNWAMAARDDTRAWADRSDNGAWTRQSSLEEDGASQDSLNNRRHSGEVYFTELRSALEGEAYMDDERVRGQIQMHLARVRVWMDPSEDLLEPPPLSDFMNF